MEEQKTEGQAQEQKRPGLLSVMCILTYIFSGIGVIVGLLALIAAGILANIMPASLSGVMTSGGGMVGGIVFLVTTIGTFLGAIMMWKLKKTGFYLYSGSYLVRFIVPIFLPYGAFQIFPLIIMAAFIVLYGVNLKTMQ